MLWPSNASADIAPHPLSGGVTLGRNGGATNHVAMVEEVVRLSVSETECRTTATFQMKNVTRGPVEMQVGFPFAFEGDLVDFVAKVDGKPVDGIKDTPPVRRRQWKVWQMTFPADKTTTIEVSYRNQLQGIYSWTVGLASGSVDRTLLDRAGEAERAELEKRLVCRDVKYILETGRGWAGPIGRCRVEVTLEGLKVDNLLPQYPRPLIEDGMLRHAPEVRTNTIVWDVQDYEPESDISFQVTPHITRQEMHDLLARFNARFPDDPKIARHLAEHLRIAGRVDEADAVREELLKRWHGRIALWGPETGDLEALKNSREVWGLVLPMIGTFGKDYEATSPGRAAQVIEPIAKRLREQIDLAPPDDRFAKLFRSQIDAALAWCQKHAKAPTREPKP
jgi:hypothetical protein